MTLRTRVIFGAAMSLAMSTLAAQPAPSGTPSDNVRLYEAMPAGAQSLGQVKAFRCLPSPAVENDVSKTMVRDDLLVQALRLGADGITNVNIAPSSRAEQNCPHPLLGTADAFKK